MFKKFLSLVTSLLVLVTFYSAVATTAADASARQVKQLKTKIVALAEKFRGQTDADRSKQQQLTVLVDQLVKLTKPLPVKDRLSLLDGAWWQIWGPYNYRDRSATIDPKIDVNRIYQVVSQDGYYYNVTPDPTKKTIKISLLRGVFALNSKEVNTLNVRFTKLTKLESCPARGIDFIKLAAASEAGKLRREKTAVPSLIVKLFFDKGRLREVYTDKDLRITYGTGAYSVNGDIYVMKRVKKAPILLCE